MATPIFGSPQVYGNQSYYREDELEPGAPLGGIGFHENPMVEGQPLQANPKPLLDRVIDLFKSPFVTAASYFPAIPVPFVKLATIAFIIGGLFVGTILSGGAASSLASGGASLTLVALAGSGCAALGLGTIYSLFSIQNNSMLEDTGNNYRDSAAFAAESVFFSFYCLILAVRFAAEVALIEAVSRGR